MTLKLARMDGGTMDLSPEVLQSFKAAFKGPVLTADDPLYEETRKIWNAMIDRRPGLVARCTGTVDVVQAVRFARQHGLLSSVRGGGHNIAGLAVCEGGLMIDMSLLSGVWIEMGVVTAGGEVLRVSADEHEDLFWALRGGSGNFGIVTSFEYRLFPVGPEILGGAIAWRGEDAKQVLDAYREFSAGAPRELTSVAVLRIAPPAPWLPKDVHGEPIVTIFVCYCGKVEDGEALIAPLRGLGRPVADIVTPRPYTQMQSLLDATQPKGRRYYWKSHYLPRIDRQTIDLAVEHAARIRSPHSAILLFQIQGALGELPAGHSPAGNRDATYVLNIAGSWEQPGDDDMSVKWARDCFEATRSCSTGGAYINFLTEDEGPDRIEAAYGRSNLDRLAALKRKYDPENIFRHTKSVSG